ncbi:hypothetical protein [Thermosulfidibacter takaii]|uniref:hypothetical protein n=1 Tax=Thermosulfidibacter takaii TaxID=412593 RepID=UPI000838E1C7|nr:hypothetical protein [Thermosulfidibacter takaii]
MEQVRNIRELIHRKIEELPDEYLEELLEFVNLLKEISEMEFSKLENPESQSSTNTNSWEARATTSLQS